MDPYLWEWCESQIRLRPRGAMRGCDNRCGAGGRREAGACPFPYDTYFHARSDARSRPQRSPMSERYNILGTLMCSIFQYTCVRIAAGDRPLAAETAINFDSPATRS